MALTTPQWTLVTRKFILDHPFRCTSRQIVTNNFCGRENVKDLTETAGMDWKNPSNTNKARWCTPLCNDFVVGAALGFVRSGLRVCRQIFSFNCWGIKKWMKVKWVKPAELLLEADTERGCWTRSVSRTLAWYGRKCDREEQRRTHVLECSSANKEQQPWYTRLMALW